MRLRSLAAFGVGLAAVSAVGVVTAYGQNEAPAPYSGAAAAVVDGQGHIHVPIDYRTAYQMLGSWAVAADDGPGSKELHVVYASPEARAVNFRSCAVIFGNPPAVFIRPRLCGAANRM